MSRSNPYGQPQPVSTNSWLDDVEPTTSSTVVDYAQVQRQLLRDQDKGLDSLGEIISRQKSMAQGICTEIDLQNEILDDITDAMEDTNERLLRNTRNVAKISRKSNTCCYWVIILLLLVAIMVVAFY